MNTASTTSPTATITITRALVELKTIDQRITRHMEQSVFVTHALSGKQHQDVTEARYQSIVDLIEYRKKLKAAIVESNARVIVNISGVKMTAAEAIERKSSIKYEEALLRKLKENKATSLLTVEKHNNKMEEKLDELIKREFSKDGMKSDVSKIEAIATAYRESNSAKLVDPMKVDRLIEKLEEKITGFKQEVDLVLSESNAVTYINVL